MNAKKIVLSLLLLLPFVVMAQGQPSASIKGAVIDTAANIPLLNSSVSVLYARDSILLKYSRAQKDGSFSLSGLPRGKFILLITYPGYADFVSSFSVDSATRDKDFGKIGMILKSKLLQDVIVKGKAAAIKIKGDTTEYNAGSFEIQPNSKVEDLLKQLPGIQVDQSGKITAQGQTVQKVLVDGEEFFGDDPTLVTKNVRADMVDKVQLYDKKSDQATFTGIDDGERTKTINLKLKEDKKNGFFGKADLSGGNDEYYEGQAMFNAFKGKRKFSAYGTLSNTGKTGLGWEDNSTYGSSSNMEFTDGGIMIYGGGDDGLDSFDGRYGGQGIPVAKNGGAHYDGKWDNDKQSLNANYKVGSIDIDGVRSSLTQNNLPSGVILGNSAQNFNNFANRQKLDVMYEVKFDTTSSLKVSADGTTKRNKTRNSYNSLSQRGNNVLLNSNNRTVSNNGEGTVFNASAFWNKKLKKKGRTFSVALNGSVNDNSASGFLNSDIEYYNQDGRPDSIQNIDQYKSSDSENKSFRGNLTYTEPLHKNLAVVLNYGVSINNSSSDRKSFNRSAEGRYDQLDRSLSNNYSLDQLSNQGGAIFNYKKNNKITVNFGTRLSSVSFRQRDEYTAKEYKRHFINWNPEASYQYRFSQQRMFRLAYQGNTHQPGIGQIQPIRENTDPLNITVGNPDLKPAFSNRFDMRYSSYKVLTERSIWLYGSYNFTVNPIVNNTVTDSAGKSTYQSFNLKDKNPSSFYLSAYLDRKIKKLDMGLGVNFSLSGNTYYSLINNASNKTTSYTYSGGITISKYKQKKYSLYGSFGPSYTTNESSLQRQLNNNGGGLNADFNFTFYLPGKVQVGSDGSYQYREKTQSFNENFERFTWNASLSKTFTKKDDLKLSFTGYDLLNQNIGFDRTANGNYLTQTSYNNIRRYFMLSLTWDFNKMGGASKKQ